MQKLTVIAVGGDKEKYFLEAAEEYRKRLSRFAQTELILLKDEPIPDHPSEKEIAGVLKKEGDRIRAALPDGFLKIALCIEGKQLTSPELAAFLDDAACRFPGIAFIIGGSLGLEDDVKKLCSVRLSLSRLTLPHRLARVVLMEALYRAETIRNGVRYHK